MHQGVSIRPYAASDADDIYAAVHESMREGSLWMPWCQPEYSLAGAHSWIQTTIDRRADGSMYDFAVVDRDGRYVGGCGIDFIRPLERVATLSYWVRSSCAGHGLAVDAVREVVAWTFTNTSLNRLEILAAAGNLRSQRVAEKAGFHRDAVLKKRLMPQGVPCDAVLYSVVRPDE